MSLDYKVKTLDGIEESVQTLYIEVEGGYQLDVEGVAPKEKVKEFRDNNIELTNQMKTLEDKMAGLDIENMNKAFQTIQTMVQTESDKEMTDALEQGQDAVNALIEKRAATRADAMKTNFETELTEVNTQKASYRTQLEDAKINAELTRLAAEKGVRPTAVDDILLRGKQVFKLSDDGAVVAMKDGEVVYNKENQPLSINEYMDDLATSAPHLFEQSSGGGANNDTKMGGGNKDGFEYRGTRVEYSK